jgi:hypothetical protein
MKRGAFGKKVVMPQGVLVALGGGGLGRSRNKVGASTLVGGFVNLAGDVAMGKNSFFYERRPMGIELIMIPVVQVGM